jgi:hypothetical protein
MSNSATTRKFGEFVLSFSQLSRGGEIMLYYGVPDADSDEITHLRFRIATR